MVFNNLKFELLRYNTPDSLCDTSYLNSNGVIIEAKESVTDLGIVMSSNACFTDQVHDVCSSMRNMSSWFLRTFVSRSKDVMLISWKSLILPIHDYCSQLWNPFRAGEIQTFEIIQWSFIKKIVGRNGDDYWDSLQKYKLYSLQRRRERYQIIYIWKILEGLVPNPVINHSICSGNFIECHISQRLGRFCKFPSINNNANNYIKTLRFNSFHIHGCRLFNTLPMDIRNISDTTVDNFKCKLDMFLSSIPDLPPLPGLKKFCPAISNSIIHMIEWQRQIN